MKKSGGSAHANPDDLCPCQLLEPGNQPHKVYQIVRTIARQASHAGAGTLTLGVLPLESERRRLADAGLKPGSIEEAKDFYLLRLRDPDGNLVVLASADKD
ncbi:MAG: glyoxalase/bleomycin resistance/dioxygenase family protein [Pseudomonadota bacterium]